MSEEAAANLEAYALAEHLVVGRRLGSGIHGTVYEARSNPRSFSVALKAHYSIGPYKRERDIYLRLAEHGVRRISGHHIPILLNSDDRLLVLEMTIVPRPYVLDFAGAHLDWPPEYSEEIWAEWTRKNEEAFGDRWPAVQRLIDELEEFGIFMHDPTPSNITFG